MRRRVNLSTTIVILFLSRICVASVSTAPRQIPKMDIRYVGSAIHKPLGHPDNVAIINRNDGDDDNDPDALRMHVMPRPPVQQAWGARLVRPPLSPVIPMPAQAMPNPVTVSTPKRDASFENLHGSDQAVKSKVNVEENQNMEKLQQYVNNNGESSGKSAGEHMDSEEQDDYPGANVNRDSSDDTSTRRSGNATSMRIEEEETKLKTQTKKLVKWLRNRLRKRLGEVAKLEGDMETERILLSNLNETVLGTSRERQKEIRLKLENQRKLKSFQKTIHQPDGHLQEVEEEKNKLSEQLAQITRTYETLAQVDKDLRSKLHTAGLTHWLQARGREYMPETAVGVLSKSAEILEPVTHSLEKAYEIDNQLLEEVENVVPVLANESILSKVLADFALLLPLIPVILVGYRALRLFDRLSILHIVFYASAGLLFELVILIILSACLGQEIVRACQVTSEFLLSTAVLIHFVIIFGLWFAQLLICALKVSQLEMAQVVMCLVVLHHFWRHVFVPVMIGNAVTTTVTANVGYAIVFMFVCYQKKGMLNWHTPYDAQMVKAWAAAAQWTRETANAMGNVFNEGASEDTSRRTNKAIADDRSFIAASDDSSISGDASTSAAPSPRIPLPATPDPRAAAADAARYTRWTGPTAWPLRQTLEAHKLPFNEPQSQRHVDMSQVRGRVAMSRSQRFARQARREANDLLAYNS